MAGKSNQTKLRTIRIKNEVWEYFRDKPLNKVVESVYEWVQTGEIEVSGEKIELKTFGGIYNMRAFEDVCRRLKIRPDAMLDNIVDGMRANLLEREKGQKKKSKKSRYSEYDDWNPNDRVIPDISGDNS